MKMGLAGIGCEGEWTVELTELIELVGMDLYGLTIANRQFDLQVFDVSVEQIRALQRFLKESAQDESSDFHEAFGGKIDLLNHDGAIYIRIRNDGKYGPNLLEIPVDYAECGKLLAALNEAITEAALP